MAKSKIRRLTIDERWEKGTPHDPRSEALAYALRDLDQESGGDSMDLRFGGDGDNGETLLYLLDMFFEGQGSTVVIPSRK